MAEKLKGEGRLVPTRPTGVEYRVVYGIELVPEVRQHGVPPAVAKSRWARCQVKSQHARQIPDGTYFLQGHRAERRRPASSVSAALAANSQRPFAEALLNQRIA